MTIEVDRELYAEEATTWAGYARRDVAEALLDVDTALKYVLDGVHRAQLAAAREALRKAESALQWVRP